METCRSVFHLILFSHLGYIKYCKSLCSFFRKKKAKWVKNMTMSKNRFVFPFFIHLAKKKIMCVVRVFAEAVSWKIWLWSFSLYFYAMRVLSLLSECLLKCWPVWLSKEIETNGKNSNWSRRRKTKTKRV